MESCSNQKSVIQIKIHLIFEILKIATLCLDDSFAHSWYSLNQLHEGEYLESISINRCGLLKVVEFISFIMRLSQSVVL